jgi:hypothetical protein
MSDRPVRFAGEYHGLCSRCQGHAAFAFGFADDREPRAITWDGPRCVDVAIREVQLVRQVDEALWISLEYACRGCGGWNAIRTECRAEPTGVTAPSPEH